MVLELLRKAFKARLTFTIGKSVTTGHDDCVIWNNIHHKTAIYGGPTQYSLPIRISSSSHSPPTPASFSLLPNAHNLAFSLRAGSATRTRIICSASQTSSKLPELLIELLRLRCTVLRLLVQYSNNRSVREFAYRPYEVRFGRVNLFILFFTFLSSFRSISAITIISHQII